MLSLALTFLDVQKHVVWLQNKSRQINTRSQAQGLLSLRV